MFLKRVLSAAFCIASAASAAADELPIVFQTGFESGGLQGWTLTDPKAFRIGEGDSGKCLELFQPAKYAPKVRSPFGLAILDAPIVGDFQLDVRVKSTVKDYGHRDMCIAFGYVDPEHFYYVHLGKKADPHSNSIFVVDAAPRVAVADKTSTGTDWTDGWHHVRIARDAEGGDIRVYFDDMENPVMTANDKRFPKGRIALGSFDDTGMFDDLVLRAR